MSEDRNSNPNDEPLAREPEAEESPSSGGAAPPPEAEDAEAGSPSDAVAEAQAEAKRWEDQYLRARADLDNFRRRMQREREEMVKFGGQPLLESLLPAFDNLELGLQSARQHHPEAKGVVDGLSMVVTQIQGILNECGIEVIDPAGELFDPNHHDAVAHESSEEVAENHVLRVNRRGYTMNGRLVRPASVVVSSGAPESVGASSTAGSDS